MELKDENSKEVYLYKFNSKGEFKEIKGYIKNFTKMNNSCKSLTFREINEEGKVKTRITVSGTEGEVYSNSVWYSKPNKLEALEVIKLYKMELINKHRSIVDKLRRDVYKINKELKNKG